PLSIIPIESSVSKDMLKGDTIGSWIVSPFNITNTGLNNMPEQSAPTIKRWVLLVVGLYALTLAALSTPVIAASFWHSGYGLQSLARDVIEVGVHWQYWLCIGSLSLLQGLFLLAPMEMVRNRPVPKRRWLLLAVVAGLLIGLLLAALTV